MNIRKNIDYSTMFAALDSAMEAALPQVELYCKIGAIICARPEKGAAVAAAEYLTNQYSGMGGFSPRNVRRMRSFYQMYGDVPELLAEAMHLSWTQNTVIMEAELTMEERSWYIRQADVRSLSKTELLQMIENSAYTERVLDGDTEEWYNENANETTEETQDEETLVYQQLWYLQLQWTDVYPLSVYRPPRRCSGYARAD